MGLVYGGHVMMESGDEDGDVEAVDGAVAIGAYHAVMSSILVCPSATLPHLISCP